MSSADPSHHAKGLLLTAIGGMALTVDIPLIRLADGEPWSILMTRCGTTLAATAVLWLVMRRLMHEPPPLVPGRSGAVVALLYAASSITFITAVYNTATAYSPQGRRVASYRKIFPWRPYEKVASGSEFVVFDMDGHGRVGLSICYDAWFPETSRQLAWMGAELIVNVVQTPTSDRAQEVTIAAANAIVNQVFVASVNAAAPQGVGRSLLVDPQGRARVESPSSEAAVLTDVIDLDEVQAVRRFGTAGVTRPWRQFDGDAEVSIELPLYDGRISSSRWTPTSARFEEAGA